MKGEMQFECKSCCLQNNSFHWNINTTNEIWNYGFFLEWWNYNDVMKYYSFKGEAMFCLFQSIKLESGHIVTYLFIIKFVI